MAGEAPLRVGPRNDMLLAADGRPTKCSHTGLPESRIPFDFRRFGGTIVIILARVREYFRSEGVLWLTCASANRVRSGADGAGRL
jgi:hypothetical protein